jgi:hypothetical protein
MHEIGGESLRPDGGRGALWIDGEGTRSPRYWNFSGEEFCQPCGDLSGGKEGETKRIQGASYIRGRGAVSAAD